MLQPFIPLTLFGDILNLREKFAMERQKLMSPICSTSHTTIKSNRANRARCSVLSRIYNSSQNATPTYPNNMIHSQQNHSNYGQFKLYRVRHHRMSQSNVNNQETNAPTTTQHPWYVNPPIPPNRLGTPRWGETGTFHCRVANDNIRSLGFRHIERGIETKIQIPNYSI